MLKGFTVLNKINQWSWQTKKRPDHLLIPVWGTSKQALPDDCIKWLGYNANILIPSHSKWVKELGTFFLTIPSLSMEYLGANTYLLMLL